MKELFNNIISVQFGASIAIVFLLLSRRTMKKHYVAKLRYWLWLIIALRLCLPVDINIQLNRTAPVNIPVRDYYISAQQPQIDGQMTEFEIITADQLNSRPMENTEYTQEIPPVISTVSITDILYRIWLAVAVLLGVVSVISYILGKRDIMSTAFYDDNLTAYMENLKKQMKISKQVKIAVCNYTGSPMLVGIFSPVIVLPNNEYTATQLEMIIRHELTHLKRNDILYKFILHLVSCVYWFNPLTACMARLAGKDIEISCDEDIVKTGDKQFKAEYAQTIIRVISMQNNKLILATNFSQNAKTVKERFTNIFLNRRLKAGKSVIAVFMAVVIGATSLVGCTSANSKGKNDGILNIIDNKTEIVSVNVADIDNTVSRIVYNAADDGYSGISDNIQQFDTNAFYFRMNKDNKTKYGIDFTATLDDDGKQVVLCSRENCTHYDTTCPAYICMNGDYFTIDGNLYFYSPWSYGHGEDSFDGEGKRIRVLSINENGKEIFCDMPGYTGSDKGSVITDGNNLYLTAEKEVDKNTYLIKVDMQTARYEELYRFPKNSDYNKYKLSDITADGKQIVFTANESTSYNGAHYNSCIAVFNIETREYDIVEVLKLDEFFNVEERRQVADYTIYGNYIYKVSNATGQLTKQRVGEIHEEVLVENVQSITGEVKGFSIDYTYDDKMVITGYIDDGSKFGTSKNFVFDMNTLEISPLNIRGEDSAGVVSLVRVYAVTPDYFLIALENSDYDAYVNEMAIISKKDFYNNNPQVVPVGMMMV